MTKRCSACKEEKLLDCFHKSRASKDGYKHACKECRTKETKKYREGNRDKRLEAAKLYRRDNPEKAKFFVERWRKNNKQKINKYWRERFKDNPSAKLAHSLRRRLYCALQRHSKFGSAVEDLGCSIEELRDYLESKFYPNPETGEMMTWENHGVKGWHIDHIIPLDVLRNDNTRENFLKVNHYTNLQPLWWFENIKKSNKD